MKSDLNPEAESDPIPLLTEATLDQVIQALIDRTEMGVLRMAAAAETIEGNDEEEDRAKLAYNTWHWGLLPAREGLAAELHRQIIEFISNSYDD